MSAEMVNTAKWVARLMAEDGVTPESLDRETIAVYLAEVGRRIEKIQTTYLTNPAARQAMQSTVAAI